MRYKSWVEDETLREAYLNGKGCPAISKKLKGELSADAIRMRLKRMGVTIRNKSEYDPHNYKGPNHRVIKGGYKHIRDRRNKKYVLEHRVMVEKQLGRKLTKAERVHHINFDKADNRNENYFVCKDKKHHQNVHDQGEKLLGRLIKKGIVILKKGKYVSYLIAITLLISCCADVRSVYAQPEKWQVLLAEGADQGYDGMYAVACVIRNRGGSLYGFCGAKRKDLAAFCNRQGRHVISNAKKIAEEVFELDGVDTTFGATHFENIEAFGVPYWAKGMVVTTKIRKHTFYKRKP